MRAQTLAGILAGVTLVGSVPAGAGRAAAQTLHRDGQMRCSVGRPQVAGDQDGVVGQRATNCTWRRFDGTVEFYLGSTGKVGIDLGPTNATTVIFDVSTPQPAPPGLLQGDFAGAGADLTVISGYGTDVLVGGQGAVLTPAANIFATGVNIGIGLSRLRLSYAGREPTRR